MAFKPFRPPLIRKLQSTLPATSTDDSQSHPPKRRRVGDDNGDDNDDEENLPGEVNKGNSRSTSTAGSRYVPLMQAKNTKPGGKELLSDIEVLEVDGDGGGDDVDASHFNVLWRKFTTKKHITWDGDGILTVRGGYAYLRDITGHDMGRIMFNSTLEPGMTLSIGGKVVEVYSEMTKEEYLSGRSFLAGVKKDAGDASVLSHQKQKRLAAPVKSLKAPSSAASVSLGQLKTMAGRTESHLREGNDVSETTRSTAVKSVAVGNIFKNPMKQEGKVPHKTLTAQPVPRHDPKAPGSLVMKQPGFVPKGKQIVDVVVDPLLAKHLREHQREGVKFLYECIMGLRDFNGEGAILADEMGLGKTLQAITLLWTLLKQNPIYEAPPVIKKALIVCPVTLINNWKKEFRKWLGNERIGVFVFDDKKKRITDFTMGKAYSVMIVGYEKLRTVQEELTKGAGVDIVVADEGHRLKTLQNKSGQAIQSLNTAKRIILSGTPIQNELSEFFAAVDLVNPGLLGTYKTFMKEFEGPIVRSRQPEATRKDIEKGEARNEQLQNITTMFMLRRTADILSKYLPPKTEYVLFCNPTSIQATIYRQVLASPVFQSAIGNSECALQLITILKKLCNSPSLLTAKKADEPLNPTIAALLSTMPPKLLRHLSPSSSGKLRALDQLLHAVRTTSSEKIVLVSNYTSTLNLLATLLTSLSLPFLRLDGTTPSSKRQSLVDDFNRSPASSCFAFLLSAKAGGTGLNLIGASRLILFDVDWNPATDMQAMARIHRDGQKHHCRIYRIMLKGGLEEKIWQRQVTKIGLADSVVEKKGGVAQFSREELRDLFRLDEDDNCQTHELIGCKCGGLGQVEIKSTKDQDDNTISNKSDDGYGLDGYDCRPPATSSEDQEEDFPDLLTFIKASELKIDAQELQIRRGLHPLQQRDDTKHQKKTKGDTSGEINTKTKMQHFLSQYSHIDPSRFLTNNSKAGPNQDNDIAAQIDDPVLVSVLSDEDNGIRFVFKKTASTVGDASEE
ncbi:hypothetical protein Egran_04485 [Elaphomyces granulatus]|uniref:DNA repair and recombination protein RAD54B n=1 Tax=Elaphomyces granulatus TaxID=519963 RepID=A0A232LU99_9EURO|nr:hypothetical protein Egran_04485 [Elaphomyces granulatus]